MADGLMWSYLGVATHGALVAVVGQSVVIAPPVVQWGGLGGNKLHGSKLPNTNCLEKN